MRIFLKQFVILFKLLKEVFILVFTKDSALVRGQALLIMSGLMAYEDVLPIFNLREAVAQYLELEQSEQ